MVQLCQNITSKFFIKTKLKLYHPVTVTTILIKIVREFLIKLDGWVLDDPVFSQLATHTNSMSEISQLLLTRI